MMREIIRYFVIISLGVLIIILDFINFVFFLKEENAP